MKYWENGFYLEQNNDNTRIEISDKEWHDLLIEQSKGKTIVLKNGKLVAETPKLSNEQLLQNLRALRENECFSIVNRGQVWYETLSVEQLKDLREWYKNWLNVTETNNVPTKPSWLK